MTELSASVDSEHKYLAVEAFIARDVYPRLSDYDAILASTGDMFTRDGLVIMWWIGDDLYATIGDSPHACLWINKVCQALGPRVRIFQEYPLRYNGRPIGRDEVIHITGIAATRSRS